MTNAELKLLRIKFTNMPQLDLSQYKKAIRPTESRMLPILTQLTYVGANMTLGNITSLVVLCGIF